MRKPGLWLCAMLVAVLHAAGAEFRIVGSDRLGVEFTKAVYAFAGRGGSRVVLTLDGSRPAVEQLKRARAELGVLVLPAEELAALGDFQVRPIGYHRVVVLAPAACPIESISLEQLAAVFGGAGGAPRWAEVGATGEWAAQPIALLAPEVGVGIIAEYFRHAVLRGGEFRSAMQRYAKPAALAAHFGDDSRVLALAASEPPSLAGMKVLRVAARVREAAAAPTAENLHAGKYPLRLPVSVVFRAEQAALAPLLRFLFSDEAATAIERAGVVPLPATARTAAANEFK